MRTAFVPCIVLGLCAVLAGPSASAPSPTTAPDFGGFFLRVGDLWFDPILDDDEGKPIDRLDVKAPNADDIWAGDSDNPILQPWAREIVKKNADSELRLEHVYTADDSCWPSGVPQAVNLLDEVQFLQTKDRVTILYRRDHQVRHVYLNVPHSQNPKPSWYGESVGHYEGDELVVDTIGLNDRTFVDNYRTPHTEQIHVVERFKMIDGGKTLQAVVAVDDPSAFNMPWSAIQRWRRVTDRPMSEMICAENNLNFFDYDVVPIPQADRPDF